MFTVVRIKDAIPVPACELDKPRPLAVANQIELKYSNRVIADVGLCVCLYEILELKDGLIYVSDSSVHIRAEFTMVTYSLKTELLQTFQLCHIRMVDVVDEEFCRLCSAHLLAK